MKAQVLELGGVVVATEALDGQMWVKDAHQMLLEIEEARRNPWDDMGTRECVFVMVS